MAIRGGPVVRFDRVSRERLHPTFQEAFSDYAVDMSAMTEERLRIRCTKNNVDWDVSVGAYDGDRMVGFTLIGVDHWQGSLGAFDAATGIVPGYRGQGLAKSMFDHALPRLRERAVRSFLLEVVADNEAAIRAYRKAGFEITRKLKCFELKVAEVSTGRDSDSHIPVRPVSRQVVSTLAAHTDWQPSWENSFEAIRRIPDDVIALGAFDGDSCVGTAVYTPALNWIMTIVVMTSHRRRGIATALVRRLVDLVPDQFEAVRLLNVDDSDEGMLRFLAHLGFRHLIDQYEMARSI